LKPDPASSERVMLEVEDLGAGDPLRAPFVQSTGSQSPNLGPVIKRTAPSKKKGPGPSAKILRSTLKRFGELAGNSKPWSPYFTEVLDTLARPVLVLPGGQEIHVSGEANLLELAVREVPEAKETVLLAVRDSSGRLPGEVPEYGTYLTEILSDMKYQTLDAPLTADVHPCPLCDRSARLYPNGLKGAGLNLGNMDREGAFPGLSVARADRAFALCVDCSDLLYVFMKHVSKEFLTPVAGEKALVLPGIVEGPGYTQDFLADFRRWLNERGQGSQAHEEDLLDYMSEGPPGAFSLHILWATFGQNLDGVTGAITDVLPSRLRYLRKACDRANRGGHHLDPETPVIEAEFTVQAGFLRTLLRNPNGKKSRDKAALGVSTIARSLAEAIYHGRALTPSETRRFHEALLDAALGHIDKCIEDRYYGGLTGESSSRGSRKVTLTLAGWVRHVARLLRFLRDLEVLPMPGRFEFEPRLPELRPYFDTDSGIDSREKAFAFLMGVLYGRLLRIQGGRGVNVGANALTYLKRLRLRGRDLPEFYLKVREKLLSYGAEGSTAVRALLGEIGDLGARLGSRIELDRTDTCYFLLLGQSVSTRVLPPNLSLTEPDEARGSEGETP